VRGYGTYNLKLKLYDFRYKKEYNGKKNEKKVCQNIAGRDLTTG